MIVGAVLALLSATMFAVCSVAQHRAAGQVATTTALDPGLLVRLIRRPLWLLGTVADVTGMGLQVAALALAPLVLVQPLLVSGLLLAVPLAAVVDSRRPGFRELIGMSLCTFALLVFVLVAHSRDGRSDVPLTDAVPVLVVCAAVLGATALAARVLPRGPRRAVTLAATCGVFYGVSSALVKLVLADVDSPSRLLTNWAVYALAAIGGTGFLLNQSAFQAGSLAAPLATLTVLEPIAAVAVGLTLLQEHVASGTGALLAYLGTTAAVGLGVWLLVTAPGAVPQADVPAAQLVPENAETPSLRSGQPGGE